MHETSLSRLLDAVAAGVCEFLTHILVDADRHLPFVYDKAVVLIELWRLIFQFLWIEG